MSTSRIRRTFATAASAALLLGVVAACGGGEDAAAPEKETGIPYDATGAFGELSITDETVIEGDFSIVEVENPEQKKSDWEAAANQAFEESGDGGESPYNYGGLLFNVTQGNVIAFSRGSANVGYTDPDFQDGATVKVGFACFTANPDVKASVYLDIDDDRQDLIGGEFTCGENELAEGTFKVDVPAHEVMRLHVVGAPEEGYVLYGVKLAE